MTNKNTQPQNIYDNQDFYSEYKNMRENKLNANELIEIPIMKEMLPNLKGKRILDLGCGNGNMSKYFISQGANYVLGIDISNNMIQEAKEKNNSKNIEYLVMGMEDISKINKKFDLIYSSLAFHYIEDFNQLIKDCYSLLDPDGILLYSQEHPMALAPILTSDTKKYIEKDNKRYYFVSDYNNEGIRKIHWNVDGVIKYHRTFSNIINTLINNKFAILETRESTANKEAIKLVNKYKYQNDRPYFMFLKAKR